MNAVTWWPSRSAAEAMSRPSGQAAPNNEMRIVLPMYVRPGNTTDPLFGHIQPIHPFDL
jgi:hypothetical protein